MKINYKVNGEEIILLTDLKTQCCEESIFSKWKHQLIQWHSNNNRNRFCGKWLAESKMYMELQQDKKTGAIFWRAIRWEDLLYSIAKFPNTKLRNEDYVADTRPDEQDSRTY